MTSTGTLFMYHASITEFIGRKMKLYGYPRENEDDVHDLLEMTIAAGPNRLRSIAKFFEKCADEMIEDPDGWEHCHYSDVEERMPVDGADIIVYNPQKL